MDRASTWTTSAVQLSRPPCAFASSTNSRAALRERYASFFEVSPDLNCTVVRRIVVGPWVVDREVVTGARGGPPLRAVAVYKVQDGLIQKIWFLPKE